MSSRLLQRVVQKITVEYCHLSIVGNPDGFLTHEEVRSQLRQEHGLEVITGTNLQLRIHYELHRKTNPMQRYVYVSTSPETLLADMRTDAYTTNFSISDVFPFFADKALLRKQQYSVLEMIYDRAAQRKLSMGECSQLVDSVLKELEEQRICSTDFFNEQLSEIDADWSHPAKAIAQVSKVMAHAVKAGVYDGIAPAIETINHRFQKWLDAEYFAKLQSNPLLKARSVNKILPHLAMNHGHDDKVALLVVDGFAYWQYSLLEEHLKGLPLEVSADSTLAWLPSITMLSRQAIFRGSDPLQDYKQNPDTEKRLWNDFWKQQGFGSYELQYLYDTDEFAINEGVKRLAVVTVELDEKMHSSSDYKDLCSLTENWCPRIAEKIATIVNAGYTLYLTTDHGSVLADGWRTLTQVEKVFLYKDGSRGMRHLIYNNRDEQDRFCKANAELPMMRRDNWLAIRDTRCLAREGSTMITHGGCHFMEVVIPLIKIERS